MYDDGHKHLPCTLDYIMFFSTETGLNCRLGTPKSRTFSLRAREGDSGFAGAASRLDFGQSIEHLGRL